MTRLLKIVLAPLLVVAVIGSTFYIGLFRPDAVRSIVGNLTANEVIREQLATTFVSTIIEDETQIVGLLIKQNEQQVVAVVSEVLAQPEQREQLADVAQQLTDGLLSGQETVSLDPRPIFRPLYAAISKILPLANLGEAELAELDPIVFGEDEPLPDLGILRTITQSALLLWPLCLLLGYLLYRRTGKRAFQTAGWQTLIIGLFSILSALALPTLIGSLAGDPDSSALARSSLYAISTPALWLGAALSLLGATLLLRVRKRSSESVMPSEGATDSQ